MRAASSAGVAVGAAPRASGGAGIPRRGFRLLPCRHRNRQRAWRGQFHLERHAHRRREWPHRAPGRPDARHHRTFPRSPAAHLPGDARRTDRSTQPQCLARGIVPGDRIRQGGKPQLRLPGRLRRPARHDQRQFRLRRRRRSHFGRGRQAGPLIAFKRRDRPHRRQQIRCAFEKLQRT